MENSKFREMCQRTIDYYVKKGQEEYEKEMREKNMFILVYIEDGEDYEEIFDNEREAYNRFVDICEMSGVEFAHLNDANEKHIAEFKR